MREQTGWTAFFRLQGVMERLRDRHQPPRPQPDPAEGIVQLELDAAPSLLPQQPACGSSASDEPTRDLGQRGLG